MSRKLVVLVGAAALGLAGCESARPCAGDCAAAVVTTGADADAVVPLFSSTNIGQSVGYQIFLKLADMGLEMNTVGDEGFVPALAESWSFDDSLTISFRIHPDARWHDGVPVTAADVAFTYDLYTDPAVAATAGPLLEAIESVTAADERTAVFRFSRSYPEQFYDAVYHLYIMPRHLLDTIPRDRLGTHEFLRNPVGSGPYRFVTWQPNTTIELRADSSFFLGKPGIERVIWRITPDYTTSITQLAAGDADIIEAVIGRDNIERVQQLEHIRLYEYGSVFYAYIGFNLRASGDRTRANPLFADRAMRRAVSLAIDRDAIVAAVFGEWGNVPSGPTTPVSSIWDPDRRQLPYDSAAARRMLSDIGWRDTDDDGIRERNGERLSFELLYPSGSQVREQAAVIAEQQLRAVGIEARLTPMEFNAFVDRGERGRFDAMIGMWGIDVTPSAIRGIWSSSAIGRFNYGEYRSAAFDSLLQAAIAERDPGRAQALWGEAMTVINEDAPGVWLFTPTTVAGVHERFENVTIRPDEWSATLWQWQVR